MGNYGPILYHRQLCPHCARIKRAIRDLGLEVEMRDVLFSRRNREALRQVAGQVRVPCFIISGIVVREAEEIEKFLRLRFGEK
jgi:glutaredoxin